MLDFWYGLPSKSDLIYKIKGVAWGGPEKENQKPKNSKTQKMLDLITFYVIRRTECQYNRDLTTIEQ